MKPDLQSADGVSSGVEQTLNGTGYMISTLDEISSRFVDWAASEIPWPVLDIGAAFGVATHAVLQEGVRVVANDIDPRHLDILQKRTPKKLQPLLKIAPGAFPDDLHFEPGTFSGILLSRVLHFFSGPQVERALDTLYKWLIPGGKAFVVVEASLFLDKPPLRAQYELQLEAGFNWPGFVENVKELLPKRAAFVPDQLHYLSPERLSRAFQEAGFVVETAHTFRREDVSGTKHDEPRESVGVIARKP
ncbi:MAG: hypothetical protein Tsb009_08930 [Planctomycetaceae bacterium]